jgi:hypothetical protein
VAAQKLPASLEREQGYQTTWTSPSGWPWDPSEPTPELQWPLSVQVFDKMRRSDGQVMAGLRGLTLPIRRAPWRLKPAGARDEVVAQISEDLGIPIEGQKKVETTRRRERGRLSWEEHLRDALNLGLAVGHMGFEALYSIEGGRARLRKLAPRFPTSLAKINVKPNGDLESIQQWPMGAGPGMTGFGNMGKPITSDRLVWYAPDREGANWQGVSVLRAAYKHWLLKDRLLRVDALKHERNGLGVPIVIMPQGVPITEVGKYEALAQGYRAGEKSGGALPHGADLKLKGVDGNLPDTLASIRYHDEAMLRSTLEQFLQLGSTQTGSRALGDSFIDFFQLALDAYAGFYAEQATQQIVWQWVDLNEGIDANAPELVVAQADTETDLPPDSLALLASAGIITLDDGVEEYARDRWNLPERKGDARPAPTKPGTLPRSPVLGSRGRERRTHAARRPTLDTGEDGELPGAFADVLDRRDAVEAKHLDGLGPLVEALAAEVDPGPVVGTVLAEPPPGVSAAASQSDRDIATMAAIIALEQVRQGAAAQALADVAAAAVLDGMAEGAVGAQLLLAEATGTEAADAEALYTEALDALATTLGDGTSEADAWLADQLGVWSRQIGRDLAAGIEAGATRAELEAIVRAVVADPAKAALTLQHAIATGYGRGAVDQYTREGVSTVDFLTAGDNHVDSELCEPAEAENSWPLTSAPKPPLHLGCRCCLAPAGTIQLPLTGLDLGGEG